MSEIQSAETEHTEEIPGGRFLEAAIERYRTYAIGDRKVGVYEYRESTPDLARGKPGLPEVQLAAAREDLIRRATDPDALVALVALETRQIPEELARAKNIYIANPIFGEFFDLQRRMDIARADTAVHRDALRSAQGEPGFDSALDSYDQAYGRLVLAKAAYEKVSARQQELTVYKEWKMLVEYNEALTDAAPLLPKISSSPERFVGKSTSIPELAAVVAQIPSVITSKEETVTGVDISDHILKGHLPKFLTRKLGIREAYIRLSEQGPPKPPTTPLPPTP